MEDQGIIVPSPTTTDAPPTLMPVTSAPLIVARTCSRLGRRTRTPCRNTIDPALVARDEAVFRGEAPAGRPPIRSPDPRCRPAPSSRLYAVASSCAALGAEDVDAAPLDAGGGEHRVDLRAIDDGGVDRLARRQRHDEEVRAAVDFLRRARADPAPSTPIAAASARPSSIVLPKVGFSCVIQAKASLPSFHSRSRLVGPTPRPKRRVRVPGFSTPVCASANAVPIVGWPANGVSAVRVKIRTRWSVPAPPAGTRTCTPTGSTRASSSASSRCRDRRLHEDEELIALQCAGR